MHTIDVRNTARALPAIVDYLTRHGRREPSRAGEVIVAPGPVVTVTRRPQERVLFSAVRDANPFFAVAESLWMIAGRQDAAFLNNFIHDFGKRFAESGGNIHGAYGHRWRHAFGFDQLEHVVEVLRNDPSSRQCVIAMWDARSEARDDLRGNHRDRPCNTHIYLRVREDAGWQERGDKFSHSLDLTVLCRSNDMVWGCMGANSVHFSVLQEYLAARIGVGVGVMYQFSNNAHIYVSELDRLKKRRVDLDREQDWGELLTDDRYGSALLAPIPLVDDPGTFDSEVAWLLEAYEARNKVARMQAMTLRRSSSPAILENSDTRMDAAAADLQNRFLSWTVWPMLRAHMTRSDAELSARWASQVAAPDWALAATEWLQRRAK